MAPSAWHCGLLACRGAKKEQLKLRQPILVLDELQEHFDSPGQFPQHPETKGNLRSETRSLSWSVSSSGPWQPECEATPREADATSPHTHGVARTKTKLRAVQNLLQNKFKDIKLRSRLRRQNTIEDLSEVLEGTLGVMERTSMPDVERDAERGEHTWLLVFPLPSAVTAEKQRQFERVLKQQRLSSYEAVENAFLGTVVKGAVEQAMSAGTFPSNGIELEEEPADSLRKAQQCAIELTLACLDMVNQSVDEMFTRLEGDPISLGRAAPTSTRKRAAPVCARSMPSPDATLYHDEMEHIKVFKAISHSKDLLYVCIRESRRVAELFADVMEYPVQLSFEGVEALGIQLPAMETCPAYVSYYADFRHLVRKHPDSYLKGALSVLRHIDRIRIMYDKLTNILLLQQLESLGLLSHSFPLHHRAGLHRLEESWGNFKLVFSFTQPIGEIRDYFGEEIAFYFVFLHDSIWATAILSVPALLCWFCKKDSMVTARAILSFVIVIWFRIFTKRWQQREKHYAIRWGIRAHDRSAVKKRRNYRFRAELMPSPENEKVLRPQVTPTWRVIGRALSVMLTCVFVCVLLIVVTGEHYVFFRLSRVYTKPPDASMLSAGFGSFVGVQIRLVDAFWDRISDWITDLESRTEEAGFSESKRTKAAMVKFITSISSLVFFAFVQPIFSNMECQRSLEDPEECMSAARVQLRYCLCATFIMRYVILYGVLIDIVKPFLQLRLKQYRDERRHGYEDSFFELQVHMSTYGSTELTNDYLNILLPLGFVIFFGMVSPESVLLLLLALLFRVRTSAWKLLHVYRRPYPSFVQDIGVFNDMLGFYGYMMLLSNLGLLVVDFGGVSHFAPRVPELLGVTEFKHHWFVEMFAFFFMALVLVFVWRFLEAMLPNECYADRVELRRQDLQHQRLFYCSAFEGLKRGRVSLQADRLDSREDFAQATMLT
mmetsp:Transcript_41580/g.114564  ORF Transcript_41580/g.114564 Transcript_41580/m.114564 type:complete len:944 (-) Transcript_41580:115-2946(-)